MSFQFIFQRFDSGMESAFDIFNQCDSGVGRHCLIGQCLLLFVVRVPIIGLVD